jgi:hypothetical protein
MKIEVPEKLQATKDRLIHSLSSHPEEVAPPVPQRLMEDFSERFAPAQVAPASQVVEGKLVDKVRRFFSSPAFGLAAAAVLLLGLLVPQLVERSKDGPETFRAAGDAPVADHVSRIVFVGNGEEFVAAVESSEVFEPTSLVTANDLESALFEPDPKVVVDFNAGTLCVFNRDGEKTFTEDLPKDPSDLPAAIAAALTQL